MQGNKDCERPRSTFLLLSGGPDHPSDLSAPLPFGPLFCRGLTEHRLSTRRVVSNGVLDLPRSCSAVMVDSAVGHLPARLVHCVSHQCRSFAAELPVQASPPLALYMSSVTRATDRMFLFTVAVALALETSRSKFGGKGHAQASSSYEPGRLSVPEERVPGVSILRPLRGLDCNLYENLESTFLQKYPADKFEIICSVAEEDDQAIPVVKGLMEQYPDVDATLIVGKWVARRLEEIRMLERRLDLHPPCPQMTQAKKS